MTSLVPDGLEDASSSLKTAQVNPQDVKEDVNREMVEELICMGFSELVSEKALYLMAGPSCSVETAVTWLTDHADDATLEEPAKSKLSPEEAQAKAYELQMKMKTEREKRERTEELETERLRLQCSKQMQGSQRKLDEQQRKRDMDQVMKDKIDHENEKLRQRDILKREWEERFGTQQATAPGDDGESAKPPSVVKSKKEQLIYWINQLKKRREDLGMLKNCIQTLRLYIDNVAKNPAEKKFHRINMENKTFQGKVGPFKEALEILRVCGFVEEHENSTIIQIAGSPDCFLASQALKFLDVVLSSL